MRGQFIKFVQSLVNSYQKQIKSFQGFGKKHITLQDIRQELHHMYKDLREPFRPPETEDIFNMVTKETPKTFYIGKLLEARYKISLPNLFYSMTLQFLVKSFRLSNKLSNLLFLK
jgi:hypothetical protein